MKAVITRPRRSFDQAFDGFFDGFFNWPGCRVNTSDHFAPAVNIRENENEIALTLEMPGLNKEDIKVWVENDVLSVTGERKTNTEEKDDSYVRREISSCSFRRSFSVPKTVDAQKIKADYKNGMLDIRLAKAEEAKPKEIEVKVS
jgi:HSP20 family protein